MKKFTSFVSLFALAAMTAFGQTSAPVADLRIVTSPKNPNVEILQDGKFNNITQIIGNTSENTQVALGEVDFGASGDTYKAISIELGNGWYVDGWAVFHAGPSFEESMPFAQVFIDETGGYDNYITYASNFTCNQGDDTLNWSGSAPCIEGVFYTKPVGKQNVYLTFVGGAGNIRAINFYAEELLPGHFNSNPEDPKYMAALLAPDQFESYASMSMRRWAGESTLANPEQFPDTRVDTKDDDDPTNDSWGWTSDGVIVDWGTFDFGNESWPQIILNITHWSENIVDHVEVYIDEVAEGNMIARFWTGYNLGGNTFINVAKAPNVNLSGSHKIYTKWVGGSSNIRYMEFVKEAYWPIANDCGVTLQNYPIPEDAFHMTFVGCPEGQGNPWAYEVKCKGQYEAAGNVGWTDNGTVLSFYDDGSGDALGVDFGDGSYKAIYVTYSSEPAPMGGDPNDYNFSFYIDLDPNFQYNNDDYANRLDEILAGHEPIAKVWMQGTGGWGNKSTGAANIVSEEPIVGKHELFMVYRGAGSNVFDIYLDKTPLSGVENITVIKDPVRVGAGVGCINVSVDAPAAVAVYNLQGVNCASMVVEGSASIEAAPGFYIVTVGSKAYKVVVK